MQWTEWQRFVSKRGEDRRLRGGGHRPAPRVSELVQVVQTHTEGVFAMYLQAFHHRTC